MKSMHAASDCQLMQDRPNSSQWLLMQVNAGLWYGKDGKRHIVTQYHETIGYFLGQSSCFWHRVGLSLAYKKIQSSN